ncbi:MAG: ABC transporter substrate-binding protein, partial [Gammaproteobacteria bacterium]|nr:ABC transporter substrate-binding protein [Gammaproteobacteria bacterium]
VFVALMSPSVPAQVPRAGGVLTFVVGSNLPSFDAHRESTFGVIHPIRPFYSLLIRVDPENPQAADAFECDLCEGSVPRPDEGGTRYRFRIRRDVSFHDGTALTAADVKVSLDKIIFPPEGVPSSRKAFFSMVESVQAPSSHELLIKLKYPSATFLPSLALPFNFIYSARDLNEHGYDWPMRHVNGTGPFRFVQYQPGAFVEGRRYERYHFSGRPYLDGFRAVIATKTAVRLQAIRSGRAAIEFRGFSPKARDELVEALGDRLQVQESDWNCGVYFIFNHARPPFDDPRVRRALNLAVDRWSGSRYLSSVAIVRTPGGIVFPGHPLAANREELMQLEGFGPDIELSRARARALLAEAGQSGLSLTLTNRAVDQPYKALGGWLTDEWRQIGVTTRQLMLPTGGWYQSLRQTKDFEVATDFNCQAIINPIADVSKWLGSAGNNHANYRDEMLESLHARLLRTPDVEEQRRLMRQFEQRAVSEMAHMGLTLWWYKINPHWAYVKGWKAGPSHYLNQHLDNVWLDR